MFKMLVAQISEAENYDEVFALIDTAFQQGKISWKDHQTLMKLCDRIFPG